MAAGRLQEQAQRELLLAQQQGELRLARLQLELADAAAADTRKRMQIGVVGPSQLAEAEREAAEARRRVSRIELNIAGQDVRCAPSGHIRQGAVSGIAAHRAARAA
jgi:hypothetical protein